MKGTIIIGCRGFWNYTKKPSKKCILLDEKLFGGREDGEYLDGETYIKTAFSLADQGFTVLVSSSYRIFLNVEDLRNKYPNVKVVAFFPDKNIKSSWIKFLYKKYDLRSQFPDCPHKCQPLLLHFLVPDRGCAYPFLLFLIFSTRSFHNPDRCFQG